MFKLFCVIMKKFSENVIIFNKLITLINLFLELKFFQLLLMKKNNCHCIKIFLILISLTIIFIKLNINSIKYIIKIMLSRFLFFLQSFTKWFKMIENTVVYEKHDWQQQLSFMQECKNIIMKDTDYHNQIINLLSFNYWKF